MTANPKVLAGSGVLYTDRRDFYISPNFYTEYWKNLAPFTSFISQRASKKSKDPQFKMFQHYSGLLFQKMQNAGNTDTLSAGDTATASLAVDNVTGFKGDRSTGTLAATLADAVIGMIFEVWDSTETTYRGNVLCTARSTNTVSMKNLGGSDITLVDNDWYVAVGSAAGEGTESPEAWHDELSVVWNQCQIFRTPVEITGTLYEAALRGESNELARLRMDKQNEHKLKIENAFLYGNSRIGTNLDGSDTFADYVSATSGTSDANGNAVRTTYGVIRALLDYGSSDTDDDYQNIFSINQATYGYGNFVDDMEKVFQRGKDTLYAFAGPGMMSYWSKISNEKFAGNSGWTVQMSASQKDRLGFNIRILETPHGILNLIMTPALRRAYKNYMIIIDQDNLQRVQYRPSKFRANIKTDNAYDGIKDEYFSDEGVGMTLIHSHHLFRLT